MGSAASPHDAYDAIRQRRWFPWLRRWWLLPLAGAGVSVAVCLLAAGAAGFPLDDSWIHQAFARTLATTGQFAFQPGRSAAGETSPLWVLLLLPPHLLAHGQAPVWLLVAWSGLLGAAILGALGIVAGMTAAELARRAGSGMPTITLAAALAGLATVCEWELVWSAPSGMETELFALIALAVILAASRRVRPLWLGLLAAAAVTTRPEGMLVAVLIAAGSGWSALRPRPSLAGDLPQDGPWAGGFTQACTSALMRLRSWLRCWLVPFAAAALVGSAPYVLLNVLASGQVLPSTVFAKTAEFAQTNSLGGRALFYVIGAGAVLIWSNPVLLALGVLASGHRLLRRNTPASGRPVRGGQLVDDVETATDSPHRARLSAASAASLPLSGLLWMWPLALVLAYAGRIGGAYHHGRYLFPALPPLIALCAAGAALLLLDRRWRVLPYVSLLLLAVAATFSIGRAAQVYSLDVAGINCVEVGSSRWLSDHTPAGARVATHDVGAIGYFSGRSVVDITGLIDPELVPLLHDQPALEAYLAHHHVAYIAMYSSWFPPPALIEHDLAGHEVYDACGDDNLIIYETGWR
jgi:hypothetical protein